MSVDAREHGDRPWCVNVYRWVSDYLKEGGWIEISIGVFGAWLMPHLLPLHVPYPFLNEPLWGFACFAATLFVRKTLSLPNELASHIARLEGVVGKAFYTGFYSLAAGDPLRSKFRELDESLADSKLSGGVRDLVFGFMAQSAAHVGESGLAMVDAEVSEYVKFLERLLLLPDQAVRATCVVRPYWFVSPGIRDVSLPVLQKAGHLITLRDYQPPPTRLAVYDERTIVDMLLTAFIDKEVHDISDANCPNCKAIRETRPDQKCILHMDRPSYGAQQIPEIQWFDESVNANTKSRVNLKYTRINNSSRNLLSALEDRVFVESPRGSARIDVRFSFTNLSTGILWLRWGKKAQAFEAFEAGPTTGTLALKCGNVESHAANEIHTVYETFWTDDPNSPCLLGSARLNSDASYKAMEDYLTTVLRPHVEHNFVGGRERINDPFQELMLSTDVLEIIKRAIGKLETEIRSKKRLRAIYGQLVDHYKSVGRPEAAYVVTHDRSHPEVPVVVVKWNENWEMICKQS